MYDSKCTTNDVNETRYKLFCRRQAKNESLPPSSHCLDHHIDRANYQALIWKRAIQANPSYPSPIGNGWEMREETMEPTLMTQDPAPKALIEVVTCGCKVSQCQGRCSCSSQGLLCTIACACAGEEACRNPKKYSMNTITESDSSDSSDCESTASDDE